MEPAWRELPWDTAFFGVGIGSIELQDTDEAGLRAAEEQARTAGVVTGGPPAYDARAKQAFAGALDRALTRLLRPR